MVELTAIYGFARLINDILHEKVVKIGIVHLIPKCLFDNQPIIFVQPFLVIGVHQKKIPNQVCV